MFNRGKVVWSPIELEYLAANRHTVSLNQLSLQLAKSRAGITRKLDELDGKIVTKAKNKKSVIGKRPDLNNQYVRSGWEANVCRVLREQGVVYEYEPKVFTFPGVKHGTVSYCPDLFLPATGEWIEIKGMLDGKSKTMIRRFKKHYPEQFKKLKFIAGSEKTKAALFFLEQGVPPWAYYNELTKKYKKTLAHWE